MKSLLPLMLLGITLSASASEVPLQTVHPQSDVPALGRGAEGLMNNCHSCHSLKYIKYRDLSKLGISKQKVDEWRGDQPLDAPLLAQMSEADAILSFGKAPPDLSLMSKAREGGANYVYSYLLGYYLTPQGIPGNHYYPETKMPDPLGIIGVTDAAQLTEIQGKARDIVSFLAWAADPHEAQRIHLGYYVIGYLLVLTLLLYFLKNQIWSRLE